MKWTLAVLVVAVVPVVTFGVMVLDIQRRGLSRAEKELEAAVVDEASRSVSSAIDESARVADEAAATFADEREDVDARQRRIRALVARSRSIEGIAFFDRERRFVDAVVRGARPEASAALRVPPEKTGFAVVGEGHALRYATPLVGAVEGWVVAIVAHDALAARLREIGELRFGAGDRVALVDESTAVIVGPPKRSAIFSATGTSSFAGALLLTTEFDDAGVHKVGTLRTMPDQRLAIVVERPADEAFAALTAARNAFLLALGALGVLAAFASLLVTRRVLEPEVAKRVRTEQNLRRYLPAEAAEAAASGASSLALGGERARVTVVFADVVAFTGFAESASPERAVAFLNELFTILSEIVFRHGGMVDKFIGDCVMAVFRAPDDVPRALAAAEDMHAFVASNLPRWKEAYGFAVELGIGVASGDVLVGNLGSEARMEYTVIGDAVNVAARLEALARPRQTLTTRDVVDACPDLAFTSLGEQELRGRAAPIEIFEVTP